MFTIKDHRHFLLTLLLAAGVLPYLYSCQPGNENKTLQEDVTIIPYPAKVLKRSGYIELESNFWVVADVSDTTMARLGKYLVDEIDQVPGALASIADIYSTRKLDQAITIEKVADPDIHEQGYELSITSRNIRIRGNSEQGIYYGIQSILTLINSQWKADSRTATFRKMVISDWPKYKYRVADFSELKDSIKIEDVAKSLARSKINFLIYAPNQVARFDETQLKKNYISSVRRDKTTGKKSAIMSNELLEVNVLLSDKASIKSDTLVIFFQSQSPDEMRKELMLTGQLGWSGAGKKDNEWLLEQLQNQLPN